MTTTASAHTAPVSTAFASLLTHLQSHNHRFVFVGSFATVLNGVDYLTSHIDVVVDADNLIEPYLHAIGCFTLNIVANTAIPFDTLWSDAQPLTGHGMPLRFASATHLIQLAKPNQLGIPHSVLAQLATLDKCRSDLPPAAWGTFEDAETLRRWSFLQRTPEQRLNWLIDMLEIAYASGVLKSRHPETQDLK